MPDYDDDYQNRFYSEPDKLTEDQITRLTASDIWDEPDAYTITSDYDPLWDEEEK